MRRIERVVLEVAVLLIPLFTVLNIGCRLVGGFSLAWVGELSQICVQVVCFVGIGYAAGSARHIRMTAIVDMLPYPARKKLLTMSHLLTALLMWLLALYAAHYVSAVYQLGARYPALGIPYFVVVAIAPTGLALAGWQYLRAFWANWRSPDCYLSASVRQDCDVTAAEVS